MIPKPAMTYAEIAQAMGIGEKTVRITERRALEKIRNVLRKRGLILKDIL